MASIHLQGTLVDTLGEIDVGAILTWTHLTTTGEVIATTKRDLIIPPNGFYSIDVEFGQIRLDYTTRFTERFISIVVVNGDSTATTIPELLAASVPPTDAQLLIFQDLLADTVAAKDLAEAAAVQITTTELIASIAIYGPTQVVTTAGYLLEGDGGKGSWKQNGVTAQPANQTPLQLGDALLNDGNGNQWEIVKDSIVSILAFGGITQAHATSALTGCLPRNIPIDFSPAEIDVVLAVPTISATLQEAVDYGYLCKVSQGKFIDVTVDSGHEPATGILVEDSNYGYIRISSIDAELQLDASFSSFFIRARKTIAPELNCLVNGLGSTATRCYELYTSSGSVTTGSGGINFTDRVLYANTSNVSAGFSVWGNSLRVYGNCALINLGGAEIYGMTDASGALYASRGTTVECQDVNIHDCEAGIQATSNASVNARHAIIDSIQGAVFGTRRQGRIDAEDSTITNFETLLVDGNTGSIDISMSSAIRSPTQTGNAIELRFCICDFTSLTGLDGVVGDGVQLLNGSTGHGSSCVVINSTVFNVRCLNGSTLNLESATITGSPSGDLIIGNGSSINATNTTTTNGVGSPAIGDTNAGSFNVQSNKGTIFT